ncbi:HD domain protein [hydrothermal vent metagenome]|uniref:HD domain protein n=1 Tax=hydrothermal vent metagenome TaxID=652676 RepID=A0A3B0YEM7_9ZZZZ
MKSQNLTASTQPTQESLVSLLDDVEGLVSPPDVCMRLFELIHSPSTDSDDIAGVISVDPNLTTRLLRMANSAFYRFSGKIDTISRAVTLIGTTDLYQLVLSVSAVKSFNNIPNDLVKMDTFWRHSVYTGLLARALAARANILHPERLFVAGLMHDIGSLVLYYQRPETMRDLLLIADGDEEVLYQTEIERFSFSHASVAAHLMDQWQLPEDLVQSIKWHHQPELADKASMEAHVLFLANHLVNESDQGNFMGSPRAEISVPKAMLEIVGLTEDELFFAFEEAAEQFPSTLESLI